MPEICPRCGRPFPPGESPEILCPECVQSGFKSPESPPETEANLRQGEDFYYDGEGRMVMTEAYLLRRGYCCENGCKHCPYS